MVCIIYFDVLALIRHLKCNRYSCEVIKSFNYSAVTCSLSLAKFVSMASLWLSQFPKISGGITIWTIARHILTFESLDSKFF